MAMGHSLRQLRSSFSIHGQLVSWRYKAGKVIPLGQPSTPPSNELFCHIAALSRCCSAGGDSCGTSSSADTIIALASLSASAITGYQEKNMPARVTTIATSRQSAIHNLSSIIDVEYFR